MGHRYEDVVAVKERRTQNDLSTPSLASTMSVPFERARRTLVYHIELESGVRFHYSIESSLPNRQLGALEAAASRSAKLRDAAL